MPGDNHYLPQCEAGRMCAKLKHTTMGRVTEFIHYMNIAPGHFPDDYAQTRAYINIDDNLKRIRRQHLRQVKLVQKSDNQLNMFEPENGENAT